MRIKAAAILHEGKIWTGFRHHLIIRQIVYELGTKVAPVSGPQGFLTDGNRFVDRQEAAKIAFESGQMVQHVKNLYSEDLWKQDWCSNCGALLDSFDGKSLRSCSNCA